MKLGLVQDDVPEVVGSHFKIQHALSIQQHSKRLLDKTLEAFDVQKKDTALPITGIGYCCVIL